MPMRTSPAAWNGTRKFTGTIWFERVFKIPSFAHWITIKTHLLSLCPFVPLPLISMTFYPPPRPQPPLCYGSLQLPTRFLLSPLAGYTNLPFRRIVRELGGVGLATTD